MVPVGGSDRDAASGAVETIGESFDEPERGGVVLSAVEEGDACLHLLEVRRHGVLNDDVAEGAAVGVPAVAGAVGRDGAWNIPE